MKRTFLKLSIVAVMVLCLGVAAPSNAEDLLDEISGKICEARRYLSEVVIAPEGDCDVENLTTIKGFGFNKLEALLEDLDTNLMGVEIEEGDCIKVEYSIPNDIDYKFEILKLYVPDCLDCELNDEWDISNCRCDGEAYCPDESIPDADLIDISYGPEWKYKKPNDENRPKDDKKPKKDKTPKTDKEAKKS